MTSLKASRDLSPNITVTA